MDSTTLTQQLPAMTNDTGLAQALGVSRATIWRWAKSGRIPQPRKIGDNTARWDTAGALEMARNAPTTSPEDRERGRARAMAGHGKS